MTDRKSVLVIGSVGLMQRRIQTLLEGLGWQVHTLPIQEWEQFASQGYDLSVCDWEDWAAAGKVGTEERLAARSSPFVFFSRCPEESNWMHALKVGAFDLVEAPQSSESTLEFCRVINAAQQCQQDCAPPLRERIAI